MVQRLIPRLILLDLNLPETSGRELLSQMRRRNLLAGVLATDRYAAAV
jgi:DNA-binding response OmpR family regulator